MRIHSIEKINELKRLRKTGYSINELVTKLSIPKTTVWHHIHTVRIAPKYLQTLKTKYGGNTRRKEERLVRAQENAANLLQSPNREKAIAIAMLYWGEGSKKVCEFINSDGRMIQYYLLILRKVLNVSEEHLRPTLRIFTGMSRTECLNYWAHITKIPKYRFTVRLNDGGTKCRTKYGMCRITVKKGSNILKLIHSLINQIHKEAAMA